MKFKVLAASDFKPFVCQQPFTEPLIIKPNPAPKAQVDILACLFIACLAFPVLSVFAGMPITLAAHYWLGVNREIAVLVGAVIGVAATVWLICSDPPREGV